MINQTYVKTPILISPHWDVEFHVHTNTSLLVISVMLAKNLKGKHEQPIVYTFKLLKSVKSNYNTIEHEALVMVFALYKFKIYLLGNMFVFYVDHLALVYLINKP